MPKTMPPISRCEAQECSYNKSRECHAMAITVGNSGHARCDTYYNAGHKGGVADTTGSVGACKAESCRYNADLECNAQSIKVDNHDGHPDCVSFSPR
jgi:hypothetical protein